MVWNNKVVWSEGMFLRTQHFQQQDRYLERLVRDATGGLTSYGWGVRELRLNTALLDTGKVALSEARGVLPDGTPFSIPDDVDHPPPLELSETAREGVVYLAAPVHQPGMAEIDPADAADGGARYRGHRFEASDVIVGMGGGSAPIEVGRLRVRLLHESDDRAGYVGIGVARVLEVRADRTVVLDPNYIPPCLHAGASPVLAGYLSECEGKLASLGDELARFVADPRATGVAEVADFLLLQLVNRAQPLVAHLAAQGRVHPEPLYGWLAGLAGEFATFTSPNRRPPAFPVYRHDDIAGCFRPVIDELRRSFAAPRERKAVPIPLRLHRSGVRTGEIADRGLLTGASFVLAVKASVPAETLRRRFPAQAKIGPVDGFEELVRFQLEGIRAQALPVAPRQIPFHVDTTYFELERSGTYWRKLQTSGGLAIHVADEFPDMEIECWAIRE